MASAPTIEPGHSAPCAHHTRRHHAQRANSNTCQGRQQGCTHLLLFCSPKNSCLATANSKHQHRQTSKDQPSTFFSHQEISYQLTDSFICALGCAHLCSPENHTSIENVQIVRGQLAWGSLGGNCKRSSELSSEGKGDSVPKTLQRASGGFLNRPLPRRPSTGL